MSDALSPGELNNFVGEARTEVWRGVPRERVVLFLRARRVAENEARNIVDRLYRDRTELVHGVGLKRCKQGGVLILLPATYQLAAWIGGFWHERLFVILAVIGIVGIFRLGNALPLARHPEKHSGDLTALL